MDEKRKGEFKVVAKSSWTGPVLSVIVCVLGIQLMRLL